MGIFPSLECGVGKIRKRKLSTPQHVLSLNVVDAFSSKEFYIKFLYLLILIQLCSSGPKTVQTPAMPARLEEGERCVLTWASDRASMGSLQELLPDGWYCATLAADGNLQSFQTSSIMLLTSDILRR